MRRLNLPERCAVVALVLLAWGLRWVLLMEVPPGWRDDDLIELYTFSQRIVEEGPVLYFAGASGHEPLFHTIRAPLIALAGVNQASARWLSAAAGTVTVLLTWAIGRRILCARTGLVAATLVGISFWGLMYSRVAIRHIGTLPWALVAIYWGWRLLRGSQRVVRAMVGIAVGTAGAILTYYAGRLVPVLLLLAYPFLVHQKGRARVYVVAITLGLVLTLPMFWSAAQTSGADARVSELASPVYALFEGDVTPLLKTASTTLGMAHAQGDPEWLYNSSERPVFGAAGAAAFYVAIAVLLWRWRRPQSRLLLLWLGTGITPALISLPPSSYGHTILALPAVYLVLASLSHTPPEALSWRLHRAGWLGAFAIIAVVALRDIPDYFLDWPGASMVRFLYRADYRNLATYLEENRDIKALSVGSMLFGPWDKVAVDTDMLRDDVQIRWASPERALVFAAGGPTLTFLQDEGQRARVIQDHLAQTARRVAPSGLQGYWIEPAQPPNAAIRTAADGASFEESVFGGALALQAVYLVPQSVTDTQVDVMAWWRLSAPLPLPGQELIPYPPPPGEYSGPRLSVFAHLHDDAGNLWIDDGLWVDPYTLLPGDVILQIHSFNTSWDGTSSLMLTLGLYDPLTGERWVTLSGADSVTVAFTRSPSGQGARAATLLTASAPREADPGQLGPQVQK